MKTYYTWLGLMLAIIAVGFPAAGWLYTNLTLGWAIIIDVVFIIMPFMFVSWKVVMHSLDKHKVWMFVNVGIVVLWLVSAQNIFNAVTDWSM